MYNYQDCKGHFIDTLTDVIRVLEPSEHHVFNNDAIAKFRTDSRNVKPGDVYVAINGKRVDGHSFVGDARSRGAIASLVNSVENIADPSGCIVVDNTEEALSWLAARHCRSLNTKIIGITGSVGKTTTKEMLHSLLGAQGKARKSEGNHNSTIGLPMELLKLRHGDDWMVAEMGMSFSGEIKRLMQMANPDLGLLLNVRAVHLANFASIDEIAAAKAEMVHELNPSSTLVYNMDDPRVRRISDSFTGRQISYGLLSPRADVRGRIEPLPNWRCTVFEITDLNGETHEMALPMVGRFNVLNAVAACAVALALNVSPTELKHAIAGTSNVGGRCRMIDLNQGGMLVDDTYNSNPHAVESVLRSFATLGEKHYRWIILGDMLELGDDEIHIHRELGEKLATYGFDRISLVGTLSEHTQRALVDRKPPGVTVEHFENAADAAAALADVDLPGDCRIWAKASRGIALEQVVDILASK